MPHLTGYEHIGILRLSALGDVVMLVPVVRTLQVIYPRLKITWIVARPFNELVQDIKGIDFVVIDKPRHGLDYLRLYQRFKKIRFDILLALQANARANLLTAMLRADLKIGYDDRRAKDMQRWVIDKQIAFVNQHIVDRYFAFIEKLGVQEKKLIWDLPIAEADDAWAKAHLFQDNSRLLAINPVSTKTECNWLTQRYIAVSQEAIRRWQVNVVLTGSANAFEREVTEEIAAALPQEKVINLAGQTNLRQLAAVLNRASCLLAPDTGPAHLAAAMDVPVVGLYANRSAKKSGPYGLSDLTVDVYREAVIQFLKKNPDKLSWDTKIHDAKAMELISEQAVLEKLSMVFGSA